MTKDDLIRFEKEVADRFEAKLIPGPIHLNSETQAEPLIEIFKDIKPSDYVFSTWRSHYHALLHGVPEEKVMAEIMKGKSMNMYFPEYNFFTSAIVGGIMPIATGVAAALKRDDLDRRIWCGTGQKVWCFIGDMAGNVGIAHDCYNFARGLPITFIIEDNGLSCNTPTSEVTDDDSYPLIREIVHYRYERAVPHCGCGKWVNF